MRLFRSIVLLSLIFSALFLILDALYPLDIQRLQKPLSPCIYDNKGHLVHIKLSSDGFLRILLEKEEITPKIQNVVLGYEDRYFYYHCGFNPFSIVRALYFNLTHQKRLGASTITMQVARMMHHKRRTISQKLKEIFYALQLEYHFSKEEILQFYLNNAPYGGNVEGLASAAWKYFQTTPTQLTLAQIAYLTSIPKNPNKNRPKSTQQINALKERVLHRLFQEKEVFLALKEDLHCLPKPLPKEIPHLSAYIKKGGKSYTTIDLKLQHYIERLLYQETEKLHPYHIYNASAVVVDNQTHKILAYVGSQNFYDPLHGGENDGINASRSPGSTLKPFIYAKALEEGLITPQKKLFDLPLFLAGYAPLNYDKSYLGEVSAKEALQRSLNIPAIELDQLLKKRGLYALLQKISLRTLTQPKSYYGSALVLGGFGITLKDLTDLFCTLANGGIYQKTTYLQHQPPSKGKRLLSKEACYIVSEILQDAPRKEFSSSWEFLQSATKVAFKTGTSAYAKDMLTIGYTPEYSVGVWFGNFDGSKSHPFKGKYPTGLKVASPVMLKIFAKLRPKKWFSKPKKVTTKEICQDPIPFQTCQQKITDIAIEGVSLHTPCKTLRAEVLAYLLKTKRIKSFLSLEHNPCFPIWKKYKPLITSPVHNQTYIHTKALPKAFKKSKLQCYSFENNTTIYYLIDNQPPLKAHSSQAIFRYLPPGEHHISCLDEGAKMRTVRVFMKEE